MIAFVVENPTLLMGGIGFAIQWGYSMNRLKTLENAIDELKLEIREIKK